MFTKEISLHFLVQLLLQKKASKRIHRCFLHDWTKANGPYFVLSVFKTKNTYSRLLQLCRDKKLQLDSNSRATSREISACVFCALNIILSRAPQLTSRLQVCHVIYIVLTCDRLVRPTNLDTSSRSKKIAGTRTTRLLSGSHVSPNNRQICVPESLEITSRR